MPRWAVVLPAALQLHGWAARCGTAPSCLALDLGLRLLQVCVQQGVPAVGAAAARVPAGLAHRGARQVRPWGGAGTVAVGVACSVCTPQQVVAMRHCCWPANAALWVALRCAALLQRDWQAGGLYLRHPRHAARQRQHAQGATAAAAQPMRGVANGSWGCCAAPCWGALGNAVPRCAKRLCTVAVPRRWLRSTSCVCTRSCGTSGWRRC